MIPGVDARGPRPHITALFSLLTLTLLAAGLLLVAVRPVFLRDLRLQTQALDRASVAMLPMGPVQYTLEEGDGPVALWLHGTPGGFDQAESRWPGWRTLSVSRPGYLDTPLSVGAQPHEQAHAMAALLDHLALDEVVVVAVSGGGPPGLSLAIHHPQRVRGLVCFMAVTGQTRLTRMPRLLYSDPLLWALGRSLHAVLGPRWVAGLLVPNAQNRRALMTRPDQVERVMNLARSTFPLSRRREGTENDTRQYRTLRLSLERIQCPVLAIHGTADIAVPFANAERLVQHTTDTLLLAIDGADHMVAFTHADEVDAEVASFLRSLEPA